ncbi:MAG: dTDP-glucose 4,6-dehydratase [Acidobacteria bacterium]|nr:dTDP-glucose 4,6-dehydratase [Acidobacteriota bacterium]
MDTLIVTGAAGFIGSNFVRLALEATGDRVLVVDKLTYAGHIENLDPVRANPRFEFVQGDIADREKMRILVGAHNPRAIVNFAAETHVDRSIDDPTPVVMTNVVGAWELLEAARHHLDRQPAEQRERFRFVQVSTDEVFGTLEHDGGKFSERSPYAPNSPYAATKAAADHLARAYERTFGVPTIVTHCGNNYGPRQFPEKLVPLMILNALEGRSLPIYGDGGNVRDWLYVDDHCEGILRALAAGTPGAHYVFGGEEERTNLELVDLVCDLLERESPAAANPALRARGVAGYRELKTFVADRPGHDRRYAIDPSRARAELGWRPRHDLAAGMAATVRWYLDNREWCERVQGAYRRERLGLGRSDA